MSLRLFVIGIAILTIALSGCTVPSQTTGSEESAGVVCNDPYIRHADGCCIDQNANSICDNDEEPRAAEEEPTADGLTGNILPTPSEIMCGAGYDNPGPIVDENGETYEDFDAWLVDVIDHPESTVDNEEELATSLANGFAEAVDVTPERVIARSGGDPAEMWRLYGWTQGLFETTRGLYDCAGNSSYPW